jgi:hypothetical protein
MRPHAAENRVGEGFDIDDIMPQPELGAEVLPGSFRSLPATPFPLKKGAKKAAADLLEKDLNTPIFGDTTPHGRPSLRSVRFVHFREDFQIFAGEFRLEPTHFQRLKSANVL